MYGPRLLDIMIKPDGVQRSLVGEIIKRFEAKGYKLVAMKLVAPGKSHMEEHYADLSSKGFFAGLIEVRDSRNVLPMLLSKRSLCQCRGSVSTRGLDNGTRWNY